MPHKPIRLCNGRHFGSS